MVFKRKKRGVIGIVLLTIALFLLSGRLNVYSANITLKLGFVTSANKDDPYYITSKKFATLIEKYTNGRYKVNLYPSGELGNERNMIKNLMVGTMDLGVITNAPVGSFVHSFMILDMPFVFPNYEVAHKVLDGKAGKMLLSKLKQINIKGLAFAEGGFREMINNVHPIYKTSDLKGIKFRVMRTPIYIALFRSLGANAVPLPWGSAFTAVQQHVVDGLEIPVPVIWANKFHEVTKYLSLTNHTYSPLIIMVSGSLWNKLSSKDKKIFQKAAIEAANYERKTIEGIINELIKKLEEKGMKVNKVSNIKPFMEAVKPVYKEFEPKIGKKVMETVLKSRNAAMK